jgi:DNA-binding NarL/FixJ family response regulator
MRLGKILTSLIKPELEELRELLNLTDDELKVFDGLTKGMTKTEIALKYDSSVPTVSNRIKSISNKINHLKEVVNSAERN